MAYLIYLALFGCLGFHIRAQTYQDLYALHQTLFSTYSTNMRPILDQSQPITLHPAFQLISLVELDEKQQKFTINGLLVLKWTDEVLTWNPSDHNGITRIAPDSTLIWKPRFSTLNTMDDRDLFEDDYAPINVNYDGSVVWYPGGLFPILCLLDLRKFPFDEHDCRISMAPMYMNASDVTFDLTAASVVNSMFIENGEWDLVSASLSVQALDPIDNSVYDSLNINLTIKRRSAFFIINIFLPILFLSALNVLSFVMPEDDGGKIGFSVTVLLSMAVYMGIISDSLPSSSENMPYMTLYTFVLFTISVVASVVNICIAWLYHQEMETEKEQKRSSHISGASSKLKAFSIIKNLQGSSQHSKIHPHPPKLLGTSGEDVLESQMKEIPAVSGDGETVNVFQKRQPSLKTTKDGLRARFPFSTKKTAKGEIGSENPYGRIQVNRYKGLAKKVNFYSLIVFSVVTLILTMAILILIAS